MLIPITKKSRDTGFLSWAANQEKEIHVLLRGLDSVNVFFQGIPVGLRAINRKTRRISLGSRPLIDSNARHFKITRRGDALIVDVE